jgi:glycerol-3-phosphate dehydrogenase (NAD(P)+)
MRKEHGNGGTGQLTSAAVIGGGGWGTALAIHLARKGLAVRLWVWEADLAQEMAASRENTVYLPGVTLPPTIAVTSSLKDAAGGAPFLLFVVPSHVARRVLMDLAPLLKPDQMIVSATKGIENDTLLTMSELFVSLLPRELHSRLAFLSGPSFAREVAREHPTAVSVAAYDPAVAQQAQQVFTTPFFRVYTNRDVLGVELGGALKNVVAIAVGVAEGMGFGYNTRAALITRGLAEITRLGVKLGADPRTFAGLSGLGDLVLTCTSDLSRNRTLGVRLGRGETLDAILGEMRMVAEGVKTARAAYQLARKHAVDMPITEQVYLLLHEGKDLHAVAHDLMTRALREE